MILQNPVEKALPEIVPRDNCWWRRPIYYNEDYNRSLVVAQAENNTRHDQLLGGYLFIYTLLFYNVLYVVLIL